MIKYDKRVKDDMVCDNFFVFRLREKLVIMTKENKIKLKNDY